MKESKNLKELIFYVVIVVILLVIVILNNVFWKIGKTNKNYQNTTSNQKINYLVINNITYNVPFEEQWLD